MTTVTTRIDPRGPLPNKLKTLNNPFGAGHVSFQEKQQLSLHPWLLLHSALPNHTSIAHQSFGVLNFEWRMSEGHDPTKFENSEANTVVAEASPALSVLTYVAFIPWTLQELALNFVVPFEFLMLSHYPTLLGMTLSLCARCLA